MMIVTYISLVSRPLFLPGSIQVSAFATAKTEEFELFLQSHSIVRMTLCAD